jgi:hypothetical protein
MGSCRHTKDHERERAECERQRALAMEKSISQHVLATLVSIENHINRRWRKCIIVADNLSNFLHDVAHNFNDEDKQ